MMGWVIFRAKTFAAAGHFFLALFGLTDVPAFTETNGDYMTKPVFWALGFGILFSGPAWSWIRTICANWSKAFPAARRPAVQLFGSVSEIILIVTMMLVIAVLLAGNTYNPFIYFQF